MVRLDVGRRQKREPTKRQMRAQMAEAEAAKKLADGLREENRLLQARVDELEETKKTVEGELIAHQESCRRMVPDEEAPAKFIGYPVWECVEWKFAQLKEEIAYLKNQIATNLVLKEAPP